MCVYNCLIFLSDSIEVCDSETLLPKTSILAIDDSYELVSSNKPSLVPFDSTGFAVDLETERFHVTRSPTLDIEGSSESPVFSSESSGKYSNFFFS